MALTFFKKITAAFKKGARWRIFDTQDTIMIAIFWTGDYNAKFAIGATEVITKVGLFWLHESAWFGIKWGYASLVEAPDARLIQVPVVAIKSKGEEQKVAVG